MGPSSGLGAPTTLSPRNDQQVATRVPGPYRRYPSAQQESFATSVENASATIFSASAIVG